MLMEKGIELSDLLNSNIFYYKFDFQDWPTIHENPSALILPYNDNIFRLRDYYESMFGKLDDFNFHLQGKNIRPSLNFTKEIKKVKKIKYSLNILPSILDSAQITLVHALGNTDELNIFNSKVLFDLLEFKWQVYAGIIHKVSLLSHCCYLITFTVFVN